MRTSKENKLVAAAINETLKGKLSIGRYNDEDEKNIITIITSNNSPQKGVNSFGTVGLNDIEIGFEEEGGKEIRVELLGSAYKEFEMYPYILSNCVFKIINEQIPCYPGAIYKNMVSGVFPGKAMKHILFKSPFLWGGNPKEIDFRDIIITWLYAIPISDEELKFAEEVGFDNLDEKFEEAQIDIFDLNRESVI